MRYSLWLLPPSSVAADLQQTIDRLAGRLGTPRFEPHLTLLPIDGLDLLPRIAPLASVEVRPTVVSDEEDFFRCVYLKVDLDDALQGLHAGASAITGGSAHPFEPHISLVYGDLPPEVRVEIADELNLRQFPPFRVAAIAAVDTSGGVAEWRTVESRIL